jgi:hypothetical protein
MISGKSEGEQWKTLNKTGTCHTIMPLTKPVRASLLSAGSIVLECPYSRRTCYKEENSIGADLPEGCLAKTYSNHP